jgi:hypothetical protein
MEQEIRAKAGQAAKTAGAYLPETLSSLAKPFFSLPLFFLPCRRLRSTATAGAEAEGRFKVISPPGRNGVRGGEQELWTRLANPPPSDQGGHPRRRKVIETIHDQILSAAFFRVR